MHPAAIAFLAMIIVILLFPVQAELVLTLLLFGAIAGGLWVFLLFGLWGSIKDPQKNGSLAESARKEPLETLALIIAMLGLLGFTTGLFFAGMGFEPTTANGLKYWIIGGFVFMAGMAMRGLVALLRK